MRRTTLFLLFASLSLGLLAQIQPDAQHSQTYQILQDRGEVVIQFNVDNIDQVNNDLTNIMSIDQVKPIPDGSGYTVRAYLNPQEFQTFLTRNLPYVILPKSAPKALNMATTVAQMAAWDRYPTYSVYEQMMAGYVTSYPALCDLDTILSSTPSGNYRILVLKISDNVNTAENEPQFFYLSSLHGDETTGYYLMLRLINYLLTNYGTLTKVTNLVNNCEIWICPLSNPEGTYRNSSPVGSTVANSVRGNLAGVDLNRNFPDPRAGQHPDGYSWQAETQAFMTFASAHHFNMSANFHGGAEVTNYPWDTWTTAGNSNCDRLWWERICTAYVDTARLITPTYMTDTYADGVTEGGDWYVITGGHQDYMGWWHHCREQTIELDATKTTQTQNLGTKWNQNYRSLLNYIQESTYGVRGIITDTCTGTPLRARVWVNSYDQNNDSSLVYSALPVGNYHRYMLAGTYSITFSASGYVSNTINNVVLANGAATVLNVQLRPTAGYTPAVSISASPASPVCAGTSVTFTPTPVNGGTTPTYQWRINGVNSGTGSTFTTSTLNNGDVVSCIMTSGLACASPATATSNNVTMTVNPNVTPSVSISASATTICAGANVTFTPAPVNGGTPTYQWRINGVNSGTGSTFSTTALANNDVVTCVMTSTANCASPVTATSNAITMTVNPTVTPAVSISASATSICTGTSVTFTPTPVNGGTPAYQWRINGVNSGTGSTFSTTALAHNDVVTCVMTSNAGCASPVTATSNAITMTVNATLVPALTISASASTICPGTSVTFTPTPVNGGTPTYQWRINGVNSGSGSTFTSSTLNNGDVVSCVMSSSETCASPVTATSNAVTMTVNPNVTPAVSISASASTICAGSSVTFTPSPVNGGTPGYQWLVNGVNAGTGSTFSTSTLVNNDAVSCIMTSTASCALPATATSNVVTMNVTPTVTPAVSVSASATSICSGTAVTFTASPVNGGTPTYQWRINGVNSGTGNPFLSAALAQGDQVSCIMSSTANCATPLTATSNIITMTVNTTLVPAVSIVADDNTICTGTAVNFTATPVNGGTPAYVWTVNGLASGNGSTFSSTTLANGDQVQCQMTSSETCATPTSVNSNTVSMTVYPAVTPTATLSASATSICEGTNVSFLVNTTGGGIPSLLWMLNGVVVQNGGTTYDNAGLADGDNLCVVMTSTAPCASPQTLITNAISMNVDPNVTPEILIVSDPDGTVCPGTLVLYTAQILYGGSSPAFVWTVDGLNSGTASTLSGSFSDGQVIGCTLTTSQACASPATVAAVPVTVSHFTVNPVTVSDSNGVLWSSASSGNQWYEQGAGIMIGATAQSYVPTFNGNYYTVVTDPNGCSAVSDPFNVTTVGISNNEAMPEILLYPNPSDGIINLSIFSPDAQEVCLEIFDPSGRKIDYLCRDLQHDPSPGKVMTVRMDIRHLASGIYFLQMRLDGLDAGVQLMRIN